MADSRLQEPAPFHAAIAEGHLAGHEVTPGVGQKDAEVDVTCRTTKNHSPLEPMRPAAFLRRRYHQAVSMWRTMMSRYVAVLAGLCLCVELHGGDADRTPPPEASGMKILFNGKDLTG